MITREVSSVRSAALLALCACGGAVFVAAAAETLELTQDSNETCVISSDAEYFLVKLGGSGEWGWAQGNFRTNCTVDVAGGNVVIGGEGCEGLQIGEWGGDWDCHVIVRDGGTLTNLCTTPESANIGLRTGDCSLEVRGGTFYNAGQLNLGPQKWVVAQQGFPGATNNLLLASAGGRCEIKGDLFIGSESVVDSATANILRAESDGEILIDNCLRVIGSGNEIAVDDGHIRCSSFYSVNDWDWSNAVGYTNTCLRFAGSHPCLEVMNDVWLWRKARLVFELPGDGYDEGAVPFKSVPGVEGQFFKIEDDTELVVDVSELKKASSSGRIRNACLIESANGFRFLKAGTGNPISQQDEPITAEEMLEKWNAGMPRGGKLSVSDDGKRICFDYCRQGFIIRIR